jgi:hypothetical protein
MSAIFPRALPAAALVDVRPEAAPEGAKLSVVCLLAAVLLPVFLLLLDRLTALSNRQETLNTNLGAATRLVRVVDFGTSSISSSSSSSLSASTYVGHTSEAECEAPLTMPFLLILDAFLLAVDGAALLPLLVPAFLLDGGPMSEPKSLPGSSISIAMESTDTASSSSTSARPLAFPLLVNIST